MKKFLLVILFIILSYIYYPKIKPMIFKPSAMDTFLEFNSSGGDYWKINHLITKEYNDRFWRYPEKIAQQHLKQRYVPLESSKLKEHAINDKTTVIEAVVGPKDKNDWERSYCFVLENLNGQWKVAGSNPWNEVYTELYGKNLDPKEYTAKSFFTYDDQILAAKSAWAYFSSKNSITIEFFEYPLNEQIIYDLSYGSSDLFHWKRMAKDANKKFRKFDFPLVLDDAGNVSKRSQTSITFYRQDTNWKFTHKKHWMPNDIISLVKYIDGRLLLKTKDEDKNREGKTFSWDIDLDIPIHTKGCSRI